jgi:hypothetical protein
MLLGGDAARAPRGTGFSAQGCPSLGGQHDGLGGGAAQQ